VSIGLYILERFVGFVNMDKYMSMDTVSYPRRRASSSTRLCDPQHSFFSQSLYIVCTRITMWQEQALL